MPWPMSALRRHEALVIADQYIVQFYGSCLSNPEVPDAPQGPHVCIVQTMIGLQSGGRGSLQLRVEGSFRAMSTLATAQHWRNFNR